MAKPVFKPNKERPSKEMALAIARGEPLPEERPTSEYDSKLGQYLSHSPDKEPVKTGKNVSLNMQISQETWKAISFEAIGKGISRKHLIMSLLQEAGIKIDASDLKGRK